MALDGQWRLDPMQLLGLVKSANLEHGDAMDCASHILKHRGEDAIRSFVRKLLDGLLAEEPAKYLAELKGTGMPQLLRASVPQACHLKIPLRTFHFGILQRVVYRMLWLSFAWLWPQNKQR